MFKTHSTECNDCLHHRRHNTNNVSSRYSLGGLIGNQSWHGTVDDVNVSSFINLHEKDITITFEIAQNVNEIIRYYFDMDVDFYQITGPGLEAAAAIVQRVTSRFFTPLMTSDLNKLNLPDTISQMESVTVHARRM